ncbi:MAG TPA: Xaa-Pro peptidase family protein [Acidimicrobiales bacterium]|jgi:Xaa-Pro aminopeptidase|nr:Xaa-Pro peptidase family protein [Acidimicrobiales bacterium]
MAYAERMAAVRERMGQRDVDMLLLSLGADLPWLTGYTAMPLERLTMLVLPADGDAVLVVPELEAPRVVPRPELFSIRPWSETENPVTVVTGVVGRSRRRLGLSDRTWATFLLALQAELPRSNWTLASRVTAPLRAVKDADEVAALRRAATAADRVATELVTGQIPLIGRTEAEVSRQLGDRLVEEGHQSVNFAIVGSGPNAASPHHDPGGRVIGAGEAVVCDFGGTFDGYCSDITRTVFTGAPPDEFRDLYAVLMGAQAAAVDAARVGTPCQDVDGVARDLITEGGYGPQFIHRTGHGIGLEEHEDPYLVGGNRDPLAAGHAFSVEPGIYVAGRWGARIEDIVVATEAGPDPLNRADHALAVVEA